MSSGQTFRLEGGKALDAALAEFARPVAKAIGRRALKKAADPVLKNYQAATTVKSGHLQESEIAGTKLNKRQARLARKLGKSEVEVHIGTADPAGIQEEFGNVHQAPHPSLTGAWAAEGGQKAVDRIAEELWADMNKTAARAAKRAAKG